MRVTLEPAYVLHRRPWRDSSLILEIFSLNHGRGSLVARGARRPGARLYGLLQSFSPLLLSWSQKGELGTLTGAEGRGVLALQGRTLISGFYVNELLMKLLARHDPHPELYQAYERVLGELTAAGAAPESGAEQRALRLFEKILLDETGYGLVLDRDTEGAPVDSGAEYHYYPERGPVPQVTGVREGAEPQHCVRVSGRSLLALARGEFEDAVTLREARALMRLALGVCLGGRVLHSRTLFRPPAGAASGAGGEGREGGQR
jgi:DNA repair protein RecO (recombination protein O)